MNGPDAPDPPAAPTDDEALDPRRWLTLSILVITVILAAIDVSVLNVSIPAILRELHTTVPSLEWVITGYSLTYATFLMVGGRLGDIYGHRRMFVIGVSLFGTGSLIASLAPSVGWLITGEAIVEGVGASLMSPATLALLSTTFRGSERARAFAIWGATIGAAVAFGPVLGGFLTTNYSWRWSFRVNVVVAPIAVVGAMLFMPRGQRKPRTPIDLPGAGMIAVGMFLLVFAISQGATYGWLEPLEAVSIGSTTIWPSSAPLSIAPTAFAVAVLVLVVFTWYERRKERLGRNPLFEFTQLRLRTFRYGLATVTILSLGQLGLLFTLTLYLQEAEHLTAMQNGLWLLPLGLAVVVGAQVGGRLTRRLTPTSVGRLGLLIETLAYLLIWWSVGTHVTFLRLLPSLTLFGLGLGFASAQLTSVILSEVPIDRSGVAGGANSTARQIGSALGAAVIGSIITVQTIHHAVAGLPGAGLSPAARARLEPVVRALGPNAGIPRGLAPADAAVTSRLLAQSVTAATRWALLFGSVVVGLGALLSLLIPRVHTASAHTTEVLETFDDLEHAVADRGAALSRQSLERSD